MSESVKHMTPEDLVRDGRNRIVYAHNRWGNNFLIVLPHHGTCGEEDVNRSFLEALEDDISSKASLMKKFSEDYNSPFIVMRPSLFQCMTSLENRLRNFRRNEQVLLNERWMVFKRFMETMHAIQTGSLALLVQAETEGWESVYDRINEEENNGTEET